METKIGYKVIKVSKDERTEDEFYYSYCSDKDHRLEYFMDGCF